MQDNIEKSRLLQEKMMDFAVEIIQIVRGAHLPKSVEEQIIKSATSIGANYHEAINAISKTDFRSKIYIAKKEAAETKYWLELISKIDGNAPLDHAKIECQQLLMTLQKIVNTLNEKRSTKN